MNENNNPNTQTNFFNYDNGRVINNNPTQVGNQPLSQNFTREPMTTIFKEQNDEKDEHKNKNNLIFIIIIALLVIALILSFVLKKDKYGVAFVNGESVELFIFDAGSKVQEKKINDESFLGWYLNDQKYDFNEILKENIVLKAKYEIKVNKYTVKFNADGGSIIADKIVSEGEQVLLPTPTKKGYKFVEWQMNGKKFDGTNKISSNIELIAIWEKSDEEIGYVVRFNTNGGTTIQDQTVKENAKVTKPTNPTKKGYKFVEWQLNGKAYDFKQGVIDDIELTAAWEVAKKLIVKFDADGGSSVADKELYDGEAIGKLPTTTKSGYVFKGWYLDKKEVSEKTIVNNNITLKAKWLSENEALVEKAIAAIKSSYSIEKSGQEIEVSYTGCTITHLTANQINGKIVRDTSDKKITLNFEVKCGDQTKTATSQGIIKKSPYTYTAVANANMVNYDVTVKNGNSTIGNNGKIYSMSNAYMSDLTNGKAVINNDDITSFPNFQMTLGSDNKTVYVIKKK